MFVACGKCYNKISQMITYNDRGKVLVSINPDFYRPAEVDLLLGDPSKAEKELKWKREYNFTDTIEEMVQNDIDIYSGLKKNNL